MLQVAISIPCWRIVQRLAVFARLQGEVIACAEVQRRAGGEEGAAGAEVVPGAQRDAAFAGHLAAGAAALALAEGVVGIPHQIILPGGGDVVEADIAPGDQLHLAAFAAGDHLGAAESDIAPGVQGQPAVVALDINAGDAVDGGAAEAVLAADALGVGEGGGGVDVPPGHRLQAAAALDDAADVIDVVAGVQAHVVAEQDARPVGDSVGIKLQDAAAVEGAAVEEVAVEFNVDVIPGEQRAGAVDVAGFDFGVDLRHQHGLL